MLEFVLLLSLSIIFLYIVQTNIKVFTDEYQIIEVTDSFTTPINYQIASVFQARMYQLQKQQLSYNISSSGNNNSSSSY